MVSRLASLVLAAVLAPAPASACGLELILAMDVSRSVTNAEYNLQMGGLAAAFRDPDVIEAIGWVPGGVAATLTQWSGPTSQDQSIGWRLLDTPSDSRDFAASIASTRRLFFGAYTAIGEALFHANTLSATNPYTCQRRVIDVSGDGASNRGRGPAPIAQALAANGVVINGLAIQGAKPDPAEFYARNVIAGGGAFLEKANGFSDYARAIRTKLLRELRPGLASR